MTTHPWLTPAFGVLLAVTRPNSSLDELSIADVQAHCRSSGAVLVRGFEHDVGAFDRLTSHLLAECVVNGNTTRADVATANGIQTVNSGTDAIALHAEMAYSPVRPDVLCFYCVRPPQQRGGETMLCDGVELLTRMPPHLRRRFETTRVVYRFERSRMLAVQCRGHEATVKRDHRVRLFRQHEDGTVDVEFVVEAIEKTRYGGALAFANSVIVEANSAAYEDGAEITPAVRRELFALAAASSHKVMWQAGDVLVVDNSRVMHGRRRIAAGDHRQILLKMGWETARRAPMAAP